MSTQSQKRSMQRSVAHGHQPRSPTAATVVLIRSVALVLLCRYIVRAIESGAESSRPRNKTEADENRPLSCDLRTCGDVRKDIKRSERTTETMYRRKDGNISSFIITSTNARALPWVLKFHFSMHIYNSQLTMKIQRRYNRNNPSF
jgi:hypothetical protein